MVSSMNLQTVTSTKPIQSSCLSKNFNVIENFRPPEGASKVITEAIRILGETRKTRLS